MIEYFKTEKRIIGEIPDIEDGCWIKLTAPTMEEISLIADKCDIDISDVRAAMDDEESSRISLEDDYTLIIVDIPTSEIRNNRNTYTTIPLGIIIKEDYIITICSEETSVLGQFITQRVRDFSTKKQMKFTYQILFSTCMLYQSLLRRIDKARTEIESRVDKNTEDADLVDLHELESNLVYFATSLRSNGVVLDRLTRYGRIRQYEEDRDLLDDVIIENKQAIEMTAIYREVITGTRELLSTVINNRLSNVMKYLTAITIVMAIPTITSGLWGMNVQLPFMDSPYGFLIVFLLTLVICIVTLFILHKRKML